MIVLFIILQALVSMVSASSPVSCSSNNTVCEAHSDNMLGGFGGVGSVEDCRDLCYNTTDCRFITYFGPDGYPAKTLCILFSSCDTVNTCDHCVSENPSCYQRCESQYEGVLDTNVINAISDVSSSTVCWEKCGKETGCRFYSYYDAQHPVFPLLCFLLSHQAGPYQHSPHGVTGPLSCQGNHSTVCSLSYQGETSQAVILNTTDTEHRIQLMGSSECMVRILAVGSGGAGTSYGGGGGGSGYLTYYADTTSGFTEFSVTVGQSDDYLSGSSTVKANGDIILEAAAGRSGGYGGGDGYSGGGGSSSSSGSKYHGGSDGGDGEGSQGGDGTQQDLNTFQFDHFELRPGAGGFLHSGGGGGGIIVSGGEPGRQHQGQGQGYGGGGEGQFDFDSDYSRAGLPGVVLIEVVQKN